MTRKSSAQVWPRPANTEPAKPKLVVAQPSKVSYGPPTAKVQYSSQSKTSGAYVVKAKTGQVYTGNKSVSGGYMVKNTSSYTVAKPNSIVKNEVPMNIMSTSTTVQQAITAAVSKPAIPIHIKLEAQAPKPRLSQKASPKPEEAEIKDANEEQTVLSTPTNAETSSNQSSTSKDGSYTVHLTPDSDPKYVINVVFFTYKVSS